MKKMKMHRFEDLLKEEMKDPAFKKAWDESRPYYQMVKALIYARNQGEITQKELARRLNTKQSAISRFESGKNKNPTIRFLSDMAKSLGLKLEIVLRMK